MLDTNTDDSGDVAALFQDYTFQANRQIAESWVNHVIEMYPDTTEQDRIEGGFSSVQVDRYARYPERSLARSELQTPRNKYGLNPLFWAAYQGDLDQVRDLFKDGADVSSESGLTALMLAAATGRLKVLKYLLAQGEDPNALDDMGNNALLISLILKHTHVAQELIRAGVDVAIQNKQNETPWTVAAAAQYKNIMGLLKEAGVKPPSYVTPLVFGSVVVAAFSLLVYRIGSRKRQKREEAVSPGVKHRR